MLDAQHCRTLICELEERTEVYYDEKSIIRQIVGLLTVRDDAQMRVREACNDLVHRQGEFTIVTSGLKVYLSIYSKVARELLSLFDYHDLYNAEGHHCYIFDDYHALTGTLRLKRSDLFYTELCKELEDDLKVGYV